LSARLESLISSGTISVGSRWTATRTKQQFLNVFNNPTHWFWPQGLTTKNISLHHHFHP
jgi:hypothetical protein